MKPGTAPLHPVRLMDQVRERIRYLHYSLSTERKVSASNRNQALSALLFLYSKVLLIDLPWLKVAAGGTASPLDLLLNQ